MLKAKPTKPTSRTSRKNSNTSYKLTPHLLRINKRTYLRDPLASVPNSSRKSTKAGIFDADLDDLVSDAPPSARYSRVAPAQHQTIDKHQSVNAQSRNSPTKPVKAAQLLAQLPPQLFSPKTAESSTQTPPVPASQTPSVPASDIAIIESIDHYNRWIGNKMSTPVLTGLQNMFVATGLAKPPQTIESLFAKDLSTNPPQTLQNHIISTLIAHNIVVPQSDQRASLVTDLKRKKKEPHVLEFLKTLRLFGLFDDEFLQAFKPGYVNPNIPYKSSQKSTDPYDISLEIPDQPINLKEEKNKQGTNKADGKQHIITVVDTMIDCLRMAGAFDVHTVNPKTLNKMSLLVPPPSGEGPSTVFFSKLVKYDKKTHETHPATIATVKWYDENVKNETNLEKIQQLHAKNFRYDVTFSFRRKHEAVYNRIMTFNYETLVREHMGEENGELIEKFAPTKKELDLFKTQLLFNEHLQQRLSHAYLRTQGAREYISIFLNDPLNELSAEKSAIDVEIKYRKALFNKLYELTHLENYPDLYNWDLSKILRDHHNVFDPAQIPVVPPAANNGHLIKSGVKKYAILPPDELFKEGAVEKFYFLLIGGGIISPPPASHTGTINEWIMRCLVDELHIFTKISPPSTPVSSTPHKPCIYIPQVPNPQNPTEPINIDLEENELLELLCDMGIISKDEIASYTPKSNTPLLLKTDTPIQRQIKLKYLNQINPPIAVKKLLTPLATPGAESQHQNMFEFDGSEKDLGNGIFERVEFIPTSSLNTQDIPSPDQSQAPENTTAVVRQYRQRWITRRNPPISRNLIQMLLDAQELHLEDKPNDLESFQEDSSTPSQIAATRPRVIYLNDEETIQRQRTQLFVPFPSESPHPTPIEGYLRSTYADSAVTEGTNEIALFDEMLSLLDVHQDFPKIQEFVLQYFHHAVMIDFQQKYPNLFTKLVLPQQSYITSSPPSTTTIQTNSDLALLHNPQFSQDEMDIVRWLVSSLHLQYHLNQNFILDQHQPRDKDHPQPVFYSVLLPPPTAVVAELFGEELANQAALSPRSSLDLVQSHYINNVFKNYKEGSKSPPIQPPTDTTM